MLFEVDSGLKVVLLIKSLRMTILQQIKIKYKNFHIDDNTGFCKLYVLGCILALACDFHRNTIQFILGGFCGSLLLSGKFRKQYKETLRFVSYGFHDLLKL